MASKAMYSRRMTSPSGLGNFNTARRLTEHDIEALSKFALTSRRRASVLVPFIPLPEEDEEVTTWRERLASYLVIKNEYIRLFLAEFIGTFTLMTVGLGTVAQAVFSKGAEGNIVTMALGWGIAVMMAVYISCGVSGGHVNPAVTTAMVVLGRLPIKYTPVYFAGQYLGSLLGSLAIYSVYLDSLWNYADNQRISPSDMDVRINQTSGIWTTFPKSHVSTGEAFWEEVFVIAVLVVYVMAVIDERNMAVQKGMIPMLVGFGIMGITTAFAFNCGAALNPARDLAPRLFTAIAGWGPEPFTYRNGNWFWVPIVGPHIGGAVGAILYNVCVGLHWPPSAEE